MNYWVTIKNLDKKFAFSFFGLVLSICYIVYTEFIKVDKPIISFEVITNTKVVDLKEENLSSLNIIYKNKSITEAKKELRIITFKVSNVGSKTLLVGDVDPNEPPGFQVQNGDVVDDPIVLATSAEYLNKNLKIVFREKNTYSWHNIIIDPNEWFIIKLLITANREETPHIEAMGKIVGNAKIPVFEIDSDGKEESYIAKVINGNVLIHLARFLIYIFIFIFSLFVFFGSVSVIQNWFDMGKKKKYIERFKKSIIGSLSSNYEFVFNYYLRNGPKYILALAKFTEEPSNIQKTLEILDEYKKIEKESLALDFIDEYGILQVFEMDLNTRSYRKPYGLDFYNKLIADLKDNKVLVIKNNEVKLIEDFRIFLKEFSIFLKPTINL